jgi:hypothetical protein
VTSRPRDEPPPAHKPVSRHGWPLLDGRPRQPAPAREREPRLLAQRGVAERELGWDERTMTWVAFHMVSALVAAGRFAATAIAATQAEADALLEQTRPVLDEESGGPERNDAE